MKLNLIKKIIGLSLAAVFMSACSGNQDKSKAVSDKQKNEKTSQQSASNLGEAPDFTKSTMEGKELQLSDYRGEVVLLNFWATWCAPCRREIPALIDLQNKYQNQLTIVGVALDEEGFEVVRPYAEEMNINYPIVMDDYSYGEKLGGIYMVPTTYIIDQEGMIAARKIGEVTVDDLRPHLEKLLGEL